MILQILLQKSQDFDIWQEIVLDQKYIELVLALHVYICFRIFKESSNASFFAVFVMVVYIQKRSIMSTVRVYVLVHVAMRIRMRAETKIRLSNVWQDFTNTHYSPNLVSHALAQTFFIRQVDTLSLVQRTAVLGESKFVVLLITMER